MDNSDKKTKELKFCKIIVDKIKLVNEIIVLLSDLVSTVTEHVSDAMIIEEKASETIFSVLSKLTTDIFYFIEEEPKLIEKITYISKDKKRKYIDEISKLKFNVKCRMDNDFKDLSNALFSYPTLKNDEEHIWSDKELEMRNKNIIKFLLNIIEMLIPEFEKMMDGLENGASQILELHRYFNWEDNYDGSKIFMWKKITPLFLKMEIKLSSIETVNFIFKNYLKHWDKIKFDSKEFDDIESELNKKYEIYTDNFDTYKCTLMEVIEQIEEVDWI